MRLRFVILRHDMPPGSDRPDHWDLLLPTGELLKTWELLKPPDDPEPQTVAQLADHRPFYLDFEGELSGGRGRVEQWDAGMCVLSEVTETRIDAAIKGKRLVGAVALTRDDATSNLWQYSFTLVKRLLP